MAACPCRSCWLWGFVALLGFYTVFVVLQTHHWMFLRPSVVANFDMKWHKLESPCELAFYFQTNKESLRMEFSIQSVRRLLPEAPFYLLSDGGPSFEHLGQKWNVSAFHSDVNMHLDQFINQNFTCRKHLHRLAAAARWAAQQGAKYLMIWEEDTRLLRPLEALPDADVVTMGNIANTHVGAFTPQAVERLFRTAPKDLVPGDERRMRLARQYAARHGYSSGPGSSWKISSLLSALRKASDSDLDDTYQTQDLCWEDFAVARGQVIRRTPDVQQIVHIYAEIDQRSPDWHPFRNLWCLSCLDACKTTCKCAAPFSAYQSLRYKYLEVISLLYPTWSAERRQDMLWRRPCGGCGMAGCWETCKAGCNLTCPAVVHPHKETTLDCYAAPTPLDEPG